MPVNLSATSLGVAPAAAPAPDLSPPRGRPGTPPGGGADGMASRKAPGAEAVRPMGLGKLQGLPKDVLNNQPGDLNAAFAARDGVPPHERGRLMTHFAQMLDQAATPNAVTQVLDQLSEAAQGLDSPARAEMWALMAARIGGLPREAQTAAFGFFTQQAMSKLDKADMLAPLQALAGQIAVFPAEQRLNVMGVLAFQNQNNPDAQLRSLTLDPPQQARLLATLSEGIRSMGDGGQLDAFTFLRGMTLSLPPEHRLISQEALSQQVHELPADQRAESLWVIGSEIRAVAAAADPLHADRLVMKVADTLAMPHEDRAWLLGSIVHRAVGSVDLSEGPRATLLGEVRQVVAGAQWPGAEDVRQRLDAAGH